MSDITSDAEIFDAEDIPESGDFQGRAASRQRDPEVSENKESDVNQMMVKLKVSGEEKKIHTQPSNPVDDFDTDEHSQYNDWFPPHLRKKINIAIMHADLDRDEADRLRELIEDNVELTIDEKRFRPRVELLSNVASSMKDDPLDAAIREADFLFVYVTTNFTDCVWSKYQGTSSVKAILSLDKQCSLMCVRTEKSSFDNLPPILNNAPPLDCYQGKLNHFLKDVERQLYKISDKILTHKSEQSEKRREYFEKHSQNWPGKDRESDSKRSPSPLQQTNSGEAGAVGYNNSSKSMKPQPDYPKVKKPSNTGYN